MEKMISQCSQSDKRFSDSIDLKKHKRIHTGENPFKFAECEKSFSDLIDIKKHKMIHTEEKPFKCTKCDKTFSDYTG